MNKLSWLQKCILGELYASELEKGQTINKPQTVNMDETVNNKKDINLQELVSIYRRAKLALLREDKQNDPRK